MKVLDGLRVLAWRGAADSPLARFLQDLGAELDRCDITPEVTRLAAADLLIEQARAGKNRGDRPDAGRPRSSEPAADPCFGNHVRQLRRRARAGAGRNWWPPRPLESCASLATRIGRRSRRRSMPAASTPTWSRPAARWRALRERTEAGKASMSTCPIQEVALSAATSTACWCWQFDRRKLHRAGGAVELWPAWRCAASGRWPTAGVSIR